MKKIKVDLKKVIVLTLVLVALSSMVCFADVSNPGIEAAEWLKANLIAVFAVLVMVFGVILIVKRKILQGVVFLIIAGIGGIFIYFPETMARKIADTIMSWF